MTTAEQSDLKLTVRLVKWAIAVGLVAAFTFGAWVARLQSQVDKVPQLMQDHAEWREVMADLVLLQCADSALNRTEQRICARYEPRMPR